MQKNFCAEAAHAYEVIVEIDLSEVVLTKQARVDMKEGVPADIQDFQGHHFQRLQKIPKVQLHLKTLIISKRLYVAEPEDFEGLGGKSGECLLWLSEVNSLGIAEVKFTQS